MSERLMSDEMPPKYSPTAGDRGSTGTEDTPVDSTTDPSQDWPGSPSHGICPEHGEVRATFRKGTYRCAEGLCSIVLDGDLTNGELVWPPCPECGETDRTLNGRVCTGCGYPNTKESDEEEKDVSGGEEEFEAEDSPSSDDTDHPYCVICENPVTVKNNRVNKKAIRHLCRTCLQITQVGDRIDE